MPDTITITYLNREGGGLAERHTLDDAFQEGDRLSCVPLKIEGAAA